CRRDIHPDRVDDFSILPEAKSDTGVFGQFCLSNITNYLALSDVQSNSDFIINLSQVHILTGINSVFDFDVFARTDRVFTLQHFAFFLIEGGEK
ncbi:MAG TPA: hypothetical protein PKY59_14960, partial [Pyrinomonadaceae bacterium]|nr:hypothetical protein [Pyrinomonadaceae bacterium]